ncbi:transcription factor 3 [Diplodia corticola]|uniref:Transcription factor 3 n=1 Tax=Diplodia corticola TaxID=236234 RepID=A0A1J9R747_9PEZI|nr:transcription factor 3 [Diplodia corticola]OJD36353.1 transcription factor 3 [Diplodia corticola]
MAEEQQTSVPAALMPVGKPLSLIPVVLKEAALDSPTFRATAVHFGDQIDLVEKWLENYVKAAGKLVQEVSNLENTVNAFIAHSEPPSYISEAVIDHDYTMLAVKRYSEGAREFWQATIKGMKRTDFTILEPLRAFLQTDLRALKDLRRTLDTTQKQFDGLIARYAGRKKSEEASSLREEAFQLHEARKAYIKAAMDFCIMAPQIRTALDKLLVRVFSERWKEMKSLREATDKIYTQYTGEMERVRGWSREMENSERVFKRELHLARKQLEDSAEAGVRPSRELDDYTISTVPYIGSHGSMQSPAKPGGERSEKQGWLFERTITGKPARTVWVRRWFFLKNGIFGWLVHGARSGAVEESEKVGVLLCGVRPAFQEERRFAFEVKTKDKTNMLQAESQSELMDWISTFEAAKRKALEDPASTGATATPSADAAFAISPPVAPEFAARAGDHNPHGSDDLSTLKHAETLPVSNPDMANLATRSSFDVSGKRNAQGDKDGESSSRDHAARIIQKLDLHRRTTANPQLSSMPSSPNPSTGIAGLISASHNIHNFLPVAPQSSSPMLSADGRAATMPISSLAPSTFANPPAPTNLSKTAVIVSGERGIGVGRQDGVMPSGLLANLWGSTNWGYVNRFERGEIKSARGHAVSQPPSPVSRAITAADISDSVSDIAKDVATTGASPLPPSTHRKTLSASMTPEPILTKLELPSRPSSSSDEYPSSYPLALRAQDVQFRLLFPNVPLDEKVVMVFRATWNPNEQQEFPGRVYVTASNVYFYSNHLGLVLVTSVGLNVVDEITGAPGRDCDFLFIHMKEGVRPDDYSRVTVKIFLEPLKLVQRRLNYLVRNCNSDNHDSLDGIIRTLIRMEGNGGESPSMESWDNVSNIDTPIEGPMRRDTLGKAGLRIDGDLFANTTSLTRKPTRFKLPLQPVVYRPQGMTLVATEREFDISAKALFHVMFGDKSAVFQMLFRERWPQTVVQGPWVQQEGGLQRREFEYRATAESPAVIRDYQIIEVLNDHLCYVVADKKTPWYLPNSKDFVLISKLVVTHVAKSRCKLAVYTKLEWTKEPMLIRSMIERQAFEDLDLEAQDLMDIIADQVGRLGRASRTRKAVQIFGYLGQQNQTVQVAEMLTPVKERRFKLQKKTLDSMFWDLGRAMAANWISTAITVFTGVIAAIGKVFTAHTMLLGLLAFSGGMNLLWSYRDTWTWWQERNAGKFMARMGVTPDVVMSKAVYLRDIDEIFVNDTIAADFGIGLARGGGSSSVEHGVVGDTDEQTTPPSQNNNNCQQTFLQLLHNPDHSDFQPYASQFAPHLTPSTRATGTRLHRTRQNLAAYRHDLLVAMRLVNRVEREVLQAEWENWVLDENVRCRRVGDMIRKRNETDGGSVDAVMEWWVGYCGECKRALEGLDVVGLR